ncbi:MAG: hypothetical protein WAZ34_12330 [Rhodocyclaceae bacterium]
MHFITGSTRSEFLPEMIRRTMMLLSAIRTPHDAWQWQWQQAG